MKRKIFLLIFLVIPWQCLADLEASYRNRITFAELQLTPEKFIGKHVDMIGILSVNNNKVFLCESMDACLSWSPFRIQVDMDSLKKWIMGDVAIYDTCPVNISAIFRHEPHHKGNIIGELRGDSMMAGISISRSDYQAFNKNCRAWNNFVEGFRKRYGDKMDEKIQEFIAEMEAQTQ